MAFHGDQISMPYSSNSWSSFNIIDQPPFLCFKLSAFSAGVDANTPRWHPPVLDGRGPLAKAAGAGMVPRPSAAFFVHTGCMRPGG